MKPVKLEPCKFEVLKRKHRNDVRFERMPTEACYVVSIENAILLSVSYGVLSAYFDDVMSYGFLFFAVFSGLCVCYVSIVLGFCLMLVDSTTSQQIVLLDSTQPFPATAPNYIAQLSRLLARSGATCSVALFILFVTVVCEFFTDENASAADSLPTIALKKAAAESHLATQFAVSTALAVFFMAVLMLLGNSQQLASIFVRLQNMASGTGVPHKAPTTAADDLALFVRALFIAYLIACESTGTFRPLLYRSMPAFLLDFIPGMKDAVLSLRNSASLLFIAWCWTLDLLRAFLPQSLIFVTLLEVLDGVQIFGNVLSVEMLLADATLTNFACLVLMLCDAACVLCASLFRIYHKIKTWRWSSGRQRPAHAGGRAATAAPEAMHDDKSSDLVFKQQDMNINSLNMQIFAKKSN